MSLNIKNERTHDMVRELARRTGRSQTNAVEEAVARWLADLGVDLDAPAKEAKAQAARGVVADFQAELSPDDVARIRSRQDELYDESGLPR